MSTDTRTKTDPSTFLSGIIGKQVVVKLSNAIEYIGDLQTIDGYMNVVLENGKEFVNGTKCRDYGDVFIRGNNGMYTLQTGTFKDFFTNKLQCCILVKLRMAVYYRYGEMHVNVSAKASSTHSIDASANVHCHACSK